MLNKYFFFYLLRCRRLAAARGDSRGAWSVRGRRGRAARVAGRAPWSARGRWGRVARAGASGARGRVTAGRKCWRRAGGAGEREEARV